MNSLCHQLPAWQALQAHHDAQIRTMDLRQTFKNDPARLQALSINAPHVFADLSKNLLSTETEGLLQELAKQNHVVAQRNAMLAGEAINCTEDRAVMHWLLRTPAQGGALQQSPVVQCWNGATREALAVEGFGLGSFSFQPEP